MIGLSERNLNMRLRTAYGRGATRMQNVTIYVHQVQYKQERLRNRTDLCGEEHESEGVAWINMSVVVVVAVKETY